MIIEFVGSSIFVTTIGYSTFTVLHTIQIATPHPKSRSQDCSVSIVMGYGLGS
jgi:hypothetical protein